MRVGKSKGGEDSNCRAAGSCYCSEAKRVAAQGDEVSGRLRTELSFVNEYFVGRSNVGGHIDWLLCQAVSWAVSAGQISTYCHTAISVIF